MDQCCAFGSRPVLMSFDGDLLDTKPLTVGAPLYLVSATTQPLRGSRETRLAHMLQSGLT